MSLFVRFAVAAALAAAAISYGCAGRTPSGGAEVVTVGGERFTLETALDEPSRTKGLMWRSEIPERGGMLFVFPEPAVRRFWMANCLIDIDLIFLDHDGRVTAVHRMKVEPPRRDDESEAAYHARLKGYSSVYPAQFAVELRAGALDRLGVGFEDRVGLDTDRLGALAR